MKRLRYIAAWVLVLVLLPGLTVARADVMLSNGKQTAYIGENNYLYLVAEDGTVRVLQSAISDILSISDTQLYCLVDGNIYTVMLDGSSSSIYASNADQTIITSLTQTLSYNLGENGALTVTASDGSQITVANNVLYAAANTTTLFYLESTDSGITLNSYDLSQNSTMAVTQTIGPAMVTPIRLIASDTAVVILGENGTSAFVNLSDYTYKYLGLPQSDTQMVAVLGTQVMYYTLDEQTGYYQYAGSFTEASLATPTPENLATTVPQATATPAPTAASTAAATAKATTSSSSSSSSSSTTYTAVSYGQTNSYVKKMQQRLKDLGYPVGSIDSYFGDKTLRAVKLFQGDNGYTERSTASSKLLAHLYSSSATEYTAYKSRSNGNSGERVLMIQERLNELGYTVTEDGNFGNKTESAIKAFQTDAGLTVDGIAGPKTLKKLYSTDAPTAAPTATATATPTATPTATATPTVAPTEAVTATPTSTATDAVTTSPTDTPTSEPTATPEPDPTATPEPDPTATPEPDPTATPEPDPTATPVPKVSQLTVGESYDSMATIRQYLRELGHLSSNDPASGDLYTQATADAIRAFAAAQSLNVNDLTLGELVTVLRAAYTAAQP